RTSPRSPRHRIGWPCTCRAAAPTAWCCSIPAPAPAPGRSCWPTDGGLNRSPSCPRTRPRLRSRSSRGLGHRPLTAVTGVRLPYGTPAIPISPRSAALRRLLLHGVDQGFDVVAVAREVGGVVAALGEAQAGAFGDHVDDLGWTCRG